MSQGQRRIARSGRGNPLIVGVLLILYCDGCGLDGPPPNVTVPPSQKPEVSFEEKRLATVPEGVDFSGGVLSPDGRLFAYRTYVRGSFGSVYRAVLGDHVTKEGGHFEFHFSPDGKTVAAVAGQGSKQDGRAFVTVGSHTGEDFTWIKDFAFSGDGKTFAYRAWDAGKQYVLVGAKRGEAFDAVDRPSLSFDGSLVVYKASHAGKSFVVAGDRKLGTEFDGVDLPVVSPDGKRVAYVATRRHRAIPFIRDAYQRQFVVIDGKAGAEFDNISELRWSPDGQTVVYQASESLDRKAGTHRSYVIHGTKQEAGFEGARELSFSPDGKTLFYQAYQAGKWFLVAGGRKGEEFDQILDPLPLFGADGRTFAYRASKQAKVVMVVGEQAGEPFDEVMAPSFGGDGNTVVYGIRHEGKLRIVVGREVRRDRILEDFTVIGKITLSPDGKTVAYSAGFKNGGGMVLGSTMLTLPTLSPLVFSPDGAKAAFLTKQGREIWWKVLSGPFDAEAEDSRAPIEAPEEGLVGYWKFNEGDVTKAYDSSGRRNHGSYVNGPEASKEIPTETAPNPGSRAFNRERSQHVEVPSAPSLNFHGSMTLAAWVRFQEGVEAEQGILEKCYRQGNTVVGGYRLQRSKDGRLVFSVVPDRGGPKKCQSSPGKVLTGAWVHVAGVYAIDTRSSRVYVNGELVGSEGSVPPPFDSSNPLWIGSDYSDPLGGHLDEVRLYKRALSESEIRALASSAGHASDPLIQDATLLRLMKHLHLDGGLKEPAKVSIPELERAGLKLLTSGPLSLEGIELEGEVFQRSMNSSVRKAILETLVTILDSPDAGRRTAGAEALGYTGLSPLDKVAVLGDALTRIQDKPVRAAIVLALGQLGAKGIPAILTVLSGNHTSHPDGGVLFDCPDLVAFTSGQAMLNQLSSVAPGLLQEALTNKDRSARAALAYVLGVHAGKSGECFTAVAPAFLSALKDPEALVRLRAAKALGEALVGAPMEREAYRPAIAPLLEALGDRHPAVRFGAAQSLGHLGRLAPAEVSRALAKACVDPDKAVREISTYYLRKMAPPVPLLDARLDRAVQVGGNGGGPFRDTAPKGGLLVGLQATTAMVDDREIIKSLVPLYRVHEAQERGLVHGQPSRRVFESIARPGYAIGGIVAQGGNRLYGFHAVFMRVTPEGLDTKDKYAGEWIGGRGTTPDYYMGEGGTSVIGISGRKGADLDALGLVYDPKGTLESAPVPMDEEGFIQRWLVLGPIPMGDLAANPTAALEKQWIPNVGSLTPAQHEKVLVEGIPLSWRIGNSAGYSLSLGSEPDSVSIILSYVISQNEVADAMLRTGSDDGAVWYLNGREVQRFAGSRPVGKDQDRSAGAIQLKKGVNLLAAVVVNGNGETAACARFVDAGDQPVKVRAGAEAPR